MKKVKSFNNIFTNVHFFALLYIIKQPLFNEKGSVTGIIGLINYVTNYELLKKKLREQAAQMIVKQMKEKEKLFRIENRQLSVSFGISVMNSRTDNFHICITESDRNMYLEKRKKQKTGDYSKKIIPCQISPAGNQDKSCVIPQFQFLHF